MSHERELIEPSPWYHTRGELSCFDRPFGPHQEARSEDFSMAKLRSSCWYTWKLCTCSSYSSRVNSPRASLMSAEISPLRPGSRNQLERGMLRQGCDSIQRCNFAGPALRECRVSVKFSKLPCGRAKNVDTGVGLHHHRAPKAPCSPSEDAGPIREAC